MPLIKIKLFENDSVTDLNTAIAAYKAGAGAELLTSEREPRSASSRKPMAVNGQIP